MATALVIGGAATVWRDASKALELGEFAAVVSCNDVTGQWPGPIAAAVSLHSDAFPRWLAPREKAGLPMPEHVLGHREAEDWPRRANGLTGYTEYRFPGQDRSGSSGLFALKVALIDLGFERAVLCGVPMNEAGAHFFNSEPWRGAQAHRKGWEQALPQIRDRARSMSGWTRELLGEPMPEWIAGD